MADIVRCTDSEALDVILKHYPDVVGEDFSVVEWIENGDNIALQDGDNFGLFEYEYPGVFTGHYFFHSARGDNAFSLARAMLSEMYANRGAQVIRGLTPVSKRAAAHLTRRLGFTSYDIVKTLMGPCELFIMSLDEFYAKNPRDPVPSQVMEE